MSQLFVFDLDGTLISSYMDNPNTVEKDYNNWYVLFNRVSYLTHIARRGHKVAIATNQAGVAFGHVTEAQAQAKIAAALVALGLPENTPIYVCYADHRSRDPRYSDPAQVARRKPSPAMLIEAMSDAQAAAADTIYVGDMESDAQAAAAAGVRYVDADEFFSRPVAWDIVDGDAVRPSDSKRFDVEKTRTSAGYALYEQLGGTEQAVHEVARRVRVRIVRAWGEPDDDRPGGEIEVSVDGGEWVADGGDLAYVLSRA